jgi:hypothetical protein
MNIQMNNNNNSHGLLQKMAHISPIVNKFGEGGTKAMHASLSPSEEEHKNSEEMVEHYKP